MRKYDDVTAVVGMVVKVMTNMRATVWAWEIMYKAEVQMALLYGTESWVVMEVMMN